VADFIYLVSRAGYGVDRYILLFQQWSPFASVTVDWISHLCWESVLEVSGYIY